MTKQPYTGYILLYQDLASLALVGPFTKRAELSAWGRRWQKKNNDDPRWQELLCGAHPVVQRKYISVLSPETGP